MNIRYLSRKRGRLPVRVKEEGSKSELEPGPKGTGFHPILYVIFRNS